jgi:NAD(P)-dependent dehydrogenase (short-subunit alcohol dehydrogenase family)
MGGTTRPIVIFTSRAVAEATNHNITPSAAGSRAREIVSLTSLIGELDLMGAHADDLLSPHRDDPPPMHVDVCSPPAYNHLTSSHKMINARVEKLTQWPAFRSLLAAHRCPAPASGFYDWQQEGREKHRITLHRQGEDMMAERPLQGKVAMITGAGSPIGLGHAMAMGLVRAGARVVLLDLNASWLEQSAADMRSIGGADCGFTSGQTSSFWEISPDAWSRVVAVNLSGAFFMARAVVGHMLTQGWGRIIGVTTSMDTMWRKGGTPYGPSKAGHEALVAAMAQELGGTGVTANVLVPGGATYTNMTASNPAYDKEKLIRPEVMQAPVVWLASDASNGWNGRRIIAYFWDESLPLEARLEKASAPAAWPQLGRQAIFPGR